eukprot:c47355_g1_i1 orf=289-657(-)
MGSLSKGRGRPSLGPKLPPRTEEGRRQRTNEIMEGAAEYSLGPTTHRAKDDSGAERDEGRENPREPRAHFNPHPGQSRTVIEATEHSPDSVARRAKEDSGNELDEGRNKPGEPQSPSNPHPS